MMEITELWAQFIQLVLTGVAETAYFTEGVSIHLATFRFSLQYAHYFIKLC